MAAFFTGVVRAPLTGIVLVTEMTANVTMLLPMLGACFAAMLIPTLLSDPPIYDSLRESILRRGHALTGKVESADPDLTDRSSVSRTGFDEDGSGRP
jgi:H+/Cl- antiporter ClcA